MQINVFFFLAVSYDMNQQWFSNVILASAANIAEVWSLLSLVAIVAPVL